jgi:hypothetical protein
VRRVLGSNSNGACCFREWDVVLCPVAPLPAIPYDLRCRKKRDGSRSMAKGTPISTHFSSRRDLPQRPASQRPRYRSLGHRPVCRSGCRSSDLILRTAQRSPLPNILSGSLAGSCRLRVMRGDGRADGRYASDSVLELGPARVFYDIIVGRVYRVWKRHCLQSLLLPDARSRSACSHIHVSSDVIDGHVEREFQRAT